MRALEPAGYWEIFMPDLGAGRRATSSRCSAPTAARVLKADPCGRYFETPPQTASIVWNSERLRRGRTTRGWTRAPARDQWLR